MCIHLHMQEKVALPLKLDSEKPEDVARASPTEKGFITKWRGEDMDFFLAYQWEIFIFLEVLSFVFLFGFLLIRYAFSREKISSLFLFLFMLFILLEAILAYIVFQQTGEIDTFQIVIFIFVVYACTFGVFDFKKLDRYMKGKVGKWRGIDLLTEEDKRRMEQLKDPKVVARNQRMWWYGHTVVFVIAHWYFWMNYGNTAYPFTHYITDWAWFEGKSNVAAPFTNEMVMQVSMIWIVIYAVDTIYSWSETFFPSKKK